MRSLITLLTISIRQRTTFSCWLACESEDQTTKITWKTMPNEMIIITITEYLITGAIIAEKYNLELTEVKTISMDNQICDE